MDRKTFLNRSLTGLVSCCAAVAFATPEPAAGAQGDSWAKLLNGVNALEKAMEIKETIECALGGLASCAVSMAIDRDAMIRSIYFGDAVKNWSTSTPSNKQWYMPDIVHYDYNVNEAKRLLAGLGYRDRNGDGFLEDQAGNTISFGLKTNSDNRIQIIMFCPIVFPVRSSYREILGN